MAASDPWSWEEDAFPPVAFCVRVLVQDGLSIPPFDRHAEGDGRLREVGLDAGIWREWLTSILRQRTTLAQTARVVGRGGELSPISAEARSATEVVRAPGSFCGGSSLLRERLEDLWGAYAPIGEAWKWRMSEVGRRLGAGHQQRALWNALRPFHDRLPTLAVFLIDYPEPVEMVLPPTACLIAPSENPEAYGRQVVAVAKRLAEPN
jgi:hypothetical protein